MAMVLELAVHGVLRCGSEAENSTALDVSINLVHGTRDLHSSQSLCVVHCSAPVFSSRSMLSSGMCLCWSLSLCCGCFVRCWEVWGFG